MAISTAAAILGAAGIGAVGSLLGGSEAAGAAEDASGAQVEAARIAAELGRETLGFQKEAFNATRGDQWDAFSFNRADTAPYRATGSVRSRKCALRCLISELLLTIRLSRLRVRLRSQCGSQTQPRSRNC